MYAVGSYVCLLPRIGGRKAPKPVCFRKEIAKDFHAFFALWTSLTKCSVIHRTCSREMSNEPDNVFYWLVHVLSSIELGLMDHRQRSMIHNICAIANRQSEYGAGGVEKQRVMDR